jgi:hypothetical protein
MNIRGLFNGIAVIIDDEIRDPAKNINRIMKQLSDKNIPMVQYESLPDIKAIDHFQNISFMIFDWRLFPEIPGINVSEEQQKQNDNANINFLIEFSKKCFCPVFIFTNEGIDEITSKLSDRGLYHKDRPNKIFIKHKEDVITEEKLFSEITQWLSETPSMYVLKQWQYGYNRAINNFFNDFQKYNPNWPLVMWKTYQSDHVNPSLEMGDLLTRNVYARMAPFDFKGSILGKQYSAIEKTELRLILQGERYVKNNNLHRKEKCTGDLFKEIEPDGTITYWLNIRAQCDLVGEANPDLYCLKGIPVDESLININDGPRLWKGQFLEKVNNAILAFIDDGCIIEFLFHDLEQFKWNDKKERRIGRVLPPYINKIQQRYASYLERQGLPRIPEDAIPASNS